MIVRNRETLHRVALLVALAEEMVSAFYPSDEIVKHRVISAVELDAVLASSPSSWLSVGDFPVWGIAMLGEQMFSMRTPLSRSRLSLRLAQGVARICGHPLEGAAQYLTTASPPASTWDCVEVFTQNVGSLLLAGGFPGIRARLPVNERVVVAHASRLVEVKLFAAIEGGNKPFDEPRVIGRSLPVYMPSLEIRGELVKRSENGGIVMHINDQHVDRDLHPTVPVYVDLGALDLNLSEISGLKSGAELELAATFPAPVFLRVGSTMIARGLIEVGQEGFLLRITEPCE